MSGRAGGINHPDYSDEWYTPADVVQALGAFDLDPCAGPKNHAARNIRRPKCGLCEPWRGRVWLNPPFSNRAPWIGKMIVHRNGVMLLSGNTKTRGFHLAARHAEALLLIGHRDLKYERPRGGGGHPALRDRSSGLRRAQCRRARRERDPRPAHDAPR